MSTSAWIRLTDNFGPAPAGTVTARLALTNRSSHSAGSIYHTNLRISRFEKLTSDNIGTFIANASILTAQIGLLQVTNALIAADINADKITVGELVADRINIDG